MTDATETLDGAAPQAAGAPLLDSIPGTPVAPGLAPAAVPDPTSVRPACGDGGDCGCGCGGARKAGGCGCGGGGGPVGFVYAIGDVRARFPDQSLEQEFRAVAGLRSDAAISRRELYTVLSQAPNIYIARDMCWVFLVEGVEVYLVVPRSFVELSDLIMALQPDPTERTNTLVVGTLGPVAPASMCNGVQLPLVNATQVYHYTNAALIQSIIEHARVIGTTLPEDVVRQTLLVLQELGDNTGQSDEHRAINFMTVRALDIYVTAAELFEEPRPFQIASVSAQPSRLSGTRRIVDVIFSFNNTVSNEVRRYFARVDVTGLFPFLASPVQQYFDRP
ncbi:MAG TPA: hypothetical protein VF092_23570 [Longimicrobium sp.]